MILVKSPYRVSLGGSDYIDIIKNAGGYSLGFAINQYSYINARILPPYFQYFSRVVYSKLEHVMHNKDIEHNAIRHAIEYFMVEDKPLEIQHCGDCPSFAGLGTSSSFLVSLVNALAVIEYKRMLVPQELINTVNYIECYLMGQNVGFQDVAWATFGGCGELIFSMDYDLNFPHVRTDFIPFHDSVGKAFEKYGILVFTQISRNASEVVGKYINTLSTNKWQKEVFNTSKQLGHRLCSKAFDLDEVGTSLNKGWNAKKNVSSYISNESIDYIYNGCIERRAAGGRLLGAGFGGSLFFVCDPIYRDDVIQFCKDRGCIVIDYKVAPRGSERVL